jgi:hypothetical protein
MLEVALDLLLANIHTATIYYVSHEVRNTSMLQSIQTKGLSIGTIFKILFIGTIFSVGPLWIIAGICSFFGAHAISLNGETVIGLKGLITGIIMAPVFSLIFACVLFLFISFGLWLYTRFKNFNINIKTVTIK